MKNIEKWLGHTFESSCYTTPEFVLFYGDVINHIYNKVKGKFEIVSLNRKHFEFSGFLKHKRTGKYIYFSSSDIRYFHDEWYHNLLIRTALHETDYTGGHNNYCKITDICNKAIDLIIVE